MAHGNICQSFGCNKLFMKIFCKHIWNKHGKIYGFLTYILFSAFLILSYLSILGYTMENSKALLNKRIDDLEKSLVILFSLFVPSTMFLMIFLFASPGYLKKKRITDKDNVIY